MDCVIIQAESGRVGSVSVESEIDHLTAGGTEYNRRADESEDNFIDRVTESAKECLSLPGAVPALIAV